MADLSLLPVPPPWSEVPGEGGGGGGEGEEPVVRYVNDITGEEIDEHPLVRLQRRQEERRRKEQEQEQEQGDAAEVTNEQKQVLTACIFVGAIIRIGYKIRFPNFINI
jgi:hypothetical protein